MCQTQQVSVGFPHSGVVSLQFVEAGMFGRNTVIGLGAPLDGAVAHTQAIGQVAGYGLEVEVSMISGLPLKANPFARSLRGYGICPGPPGGRMQRVQERHLCNL
jgi:hypothetical protein